MGEVLVQSRSPIHQSSFFMPANFLFLLITFYFFGKKLQALIDLLYNVKTVVVNTLCRKNVSYSHSRNSNPILVTFLDITSHILIFD